MNCKYIFRFAFLLFYVVYDSAASNIQHNPKIAIVGGGIGGTSCAYYLNKLFDSKVVIDLYEANNVGGRLLLEDVDGTSFEAGGTIVHPRNRYMKDFVHQFGLETNVALSEGVIGLYDGSEFVFVESKSEYVNFLKMLWHFGVDIFKLNSYVDSTLDKFDRIYDHQNNGQYYETVHSLLNAMDSQFPMYLTKSTANAFKQDNGYNERLVDELVYATIRVNYGQNNSIHQFVGSVSVAGAMGGLWSVKGGNYQVAKKLLQSSSAKLIKEAVDSVSLINNSTKFNVRSNGSNGEYDAVIIAAPMTNDARLPIDFLNFPSKISVPGSYHRTICTLVTGLVNNSFFEHDSIDQVAESIFAINESLFYNSISLLKANTGSSVYKVFSQHILTDEQLNLLFKKLQKVKIIDWLAYPDYSIERRNDTFILHDKLYYINAIEWAASAIEMSLIGGRNVALLAHNDLKQSDTKENIEAPSPIRIEL